MHVQLKVKPVAMVTALFVFFGHFRPILGSEKLVFSSYLQLHPTKMQHYFKSFFYITTKYHPWPSLRKKIIALNITLVLFLHHALQYVFGTCKIDIFTLFLDPKMSTCQGSQKIFLSAVIRANIGLSISGVKNFGNCILLWQYCLKTRLFSQKRDKWLFKGLFT